ncbi:uncharacterized protein fid [Dermacentor andersoni]|uniref:uncharacterized protein fid n=1 Tax=Dermacentor andersoni TaxID=34620 RepID=UPI00215599BD|nr:uncharacterized protein LOC126536844 [Dermacentor andersoni]
MRLRRESGGGGGGGGGNCSPEELQERRARCIALEKAYVHDVYEQLAPRLARPRLWPRVHQFLRELELGSLVADVGCGSGQYLESAGIGALGCERSQTLARAAASCGGHQVVLGDALALPFRDEALDAALSVAVLHHLASTERRVQALRELARVLRVGGRVLITVWAMEQTQRKFESQDVLVPYRQPTKSSSEDRGSSVEREMTSTTTSEDDLLVYQSYNPPASDSDTAAPARSGRRRRGSVDGTDLSSPGETCYSFMRRALRKLSSSNHRSRPYFYSSCRGGWFSDNNTTASTDSKVTSPQGAEKEPQPDACAAAEAPEEEEDEDDGLIELRHLDAELPIEEISAARSRPPSGLDGAAERFVRGHGKSRSLGDVLSIIPAMLRARRRKEGSHEFQKRISTASDPREYLQRIVEEKNGIVRSKSTASCCARFEHLREDYLMPTMVESQESPEEPEASEGRDTENKSSSRAGDEDINPTTNLSRQLTTTDIANGNSILSEEQLSSIVKEQLGYLQSPPKGFNGCRTKNWFNSFNNNANLEKCLISATSTTTVHDYISTKVSRAGAAQLARKRMRLGGQRLQEKSLLKNFYNHCSLGEAEEKRSRVGEKKQDVPMSTYYSMPDLHTLTEESTQVPERPVENLRVPLVKTEYQERSKDSFDSDIFVEDEEACRVLQSRRRVVKRSMSVGTNNGAEPRKQYRRFSASSASASMCASPTTPRSRNVSEDSEESIISVRSRKCSSLQSDTSVDSEESIVSVIQRSSSEIEAIMQRKELQRATTSSLRASPLSITLGAQEASSPEFSPTFKSAPKNSPPLLGAFPRQYLEKFSDCEAVVIRDVIGAIVSFAQCTDTIYVEQWENLADSPQQPEDAESIGEIGDNDSESGDTESYMSNPDCTAAGGDASCCEDDIPQIEFDVADLDDPYCTAADMVHEDDSLTTSSESQQTQTFFTCPSTDDPSSPRFPESTTSSSEGTLEPETEILSSENELETLNVRPEYSSASPLSPEFWMEKTNGASPTLSNVSPIDEKPDTNEDLTKSMFNTDSGAGLISFVFPADDSMPESTDFPDDFVYKKGTEVQTEEKDVDCSQTPIKLTVIKRTSPFAQSSCGGMQQSKPGEKYWEHLLPTVLSMDADDTPVILNVETSINQQCGTPEASLDNTINASVSLRKPTTTEDSSPDDSLESIEECSEEELHDEHEKADVPGEEQNSPIDTQPQLAKPDQQHAYENQTESTSFEEGNDNESAAASVVNDAPQVTTEDDVEDEPPAFNFVVEDYSEESDSCNEPAVEGSAAPTYDSLTVERLVNSTSNGSSSTASFQTVLQCPSPTTATADDDDDAEKEAVVEIEAPVDAGDNGRENETSAEAKGSLDRKESASLSSSQESLQDTDGGGSSLMLHRYYHVFREGELDSLIDKYVENLHIISSYYDRASWCVIAEKVQVWTI